MPKDPKHGSYVGGGMAYARGLARRQTLVDQLASLTAQVKANPKPKNKRLREKAARRRNRR